MLCCCWWCCWSGSWIYFAFGLSFKLGWVTLVTARLALGDLTTAHLRPHTTNEPTVKQACKQLDNEASTWNGSVSECRFFAAELAKFHKNSRLANAAALSIVIFIGVYSCVWTQCAISASFCFYFLLFACHWFCWLPVSPTFCLILLFVCWFTLLSWMLLSAHPFLTHPPVIAFFFHRWY